MYFVNKQRSVEISRWSSNDRIVSLVCNKHIWIARIRSNQQIVEGLPCQIGERHTWKDRRDADSDVMRKKIRNNCLHRCQQRSWNDSSSKIVRWSTEARNVTYKRLCH